MAQIAVKERVLAGIGYSANPLAMREPPKTPRESSSAAQSNDGETGHFPVVPWDVVAESRDSNPWNACAFNESFETAVQPSLPPKTPRNRGAPGNSIGSHSLIEASNHGQFHGQTPRRCVAADGSRFPEGLPLSKTARVPMGGPRQHRPDGRPQLNPRLGISASSSERSA